jgi:hypothetical protein
VQEQAIETKDEEFKDRADPTKWKSVVGLDHPEAGTNLVFSFLDSQSNETKKLFLNAELLAEVADGPIGRIPFFLNLITRSLLSRWERIRRH